MGAPRLSVVIPFVNRWPDLEGALSALEHEQREVDLEAIVVNRLDVTVIPAPEQLPAWIRIIPVAPGTPIPQMRAAGCDAAGADVVAIVEDHVRVRGGWAAQMLAHVNADQPAVGGSVENEATHTTVDWAAFLCEYSHCLPPIAAGQVSWLTGNNVAYWRPTLLRWLGILQRGGWENELHNAILASGNPLTCYPEIVVGHRLHTTVTEYILQRFTFSLALAGRRFATHGWFVRTSFAFGTLVLPVVLFLRISARIVGKRRHLPEFLRSLPLLLLFVVAWAAGECVGALFGEGNSLAKVR